MPHASVILPAYFSQDTVESCLRALRNQVYRDFEVILVNSSSEGETAEIARRFPEVRFIQSPSRLFPHAARNRGVEEAAGEFLVFSDPDCTADPDWLLHLVRASQEGHELAGGAMGLVDHDWLSCGIHLSKFHSVLPGHGSGNRWILPTANVAYTRAAWRRIGAFDGKIFAADAVHCWRARDLGMQPWFEPRAIVHHRHPDSLGPFLKQRFRRGAEFGAVRAQYSNWPKWRLAAYLLATPVLTVLVMFRAARDSGACGWRSVYWKTLPIQIASHLSWALGEAASYGRLLTTRGKAKSPGDVL